jgi:hypothetical protein
MKMGWKGNQQTNTGMEEKDSMNFFSIEIQTNDKDIEAKAKLKR